MANSSKRKRDQLDQGQGPSAPSSVQSSDFVAYLQGNGDGDHDLALALQQHNTSQLQDAGDGGAQDPSDTANAALNFTIDSQSGGDDVTFDLDTPQTGHQSQYPPLDQGLSAVDSRSGVEGGKHDGGRLTPQLGGHEQGAGNGEGHNDNALSPTGPGTGRRSASSAKVGTDEWHADRRRAHKDVERRRRDVINDGINELSKMVPGTERNKGAILSRAVSYIAELRDKHAAMEEKNGLAKMMFEQTVGELNASHDRLAAEVRRLEAENERLRKGAKG